MNLKIINICAFGYDRFVDAEMEDKSKIIVHFTEYVKKIVDEFSLYAKTNICDEEILIEFESKVKYGINDRIYVVGSLEFDIISSIKA